MCSSGNCDIGGLINGPVGNLVGMGIKALVKGAPIGPRSAEAIKTPTEREKIQQFYDNVEAHLNGALQVLKPALEIKDILSGDSKSADRERSAISSKPVIQYYSPQYSKKSRKNVCLNHRCNFKKSTNRSTPTKSASKSPSPHSSRNKISTGKNTSKFKPSSNNFTSSNASEKDVSKKRSVSLTDETNLKSYCKSDSKEKSSKASTTASKCKQCPNACSMCKVNLKDIIVMSVLPCEHLLCYTCLGIGNSKCCRKCYKPYDTKNISNIFY